ncbi:hypothetical protein EXN66_Car020218 [Channa argus]|uniref:Uncharacterized protein n=1 Tax=Channa argus TaxID=215402 RepID=A0A6G1QQB4_CHAAH|nr:hypothetical protein EXN66_Car020218 [Channa argus]
MQGSNLEVRLDICDISRLKTARMNNAVSLQRTTPPTLLNTSASDLLKRPGGESFSYCTVIHEDEYVKCGEKKSG